MRSIGRLQSSNAANHDRTTTEFTMATQDYTSFLGKKVSYTIPLELGVAGQSLATDLPPMSFTGRVIAIFNYADGYECFDDGSILILNDGDDDPQFISTKSPLRLLE